MLSRVCSALINISPYGCISDNAYYANVLICGRNTNRLDSDLSSHVVINLSGLADA